MDEIVPFISIYKNMFEKWAKNYMKEIEVVNFNAQNIKDFPKFVVLVTLLEEYM